MPQMKRVAEKEAKKLDKALLISIVSVILLGLFIFTKPNITGRAVLGKETIYSENLNLQKNESGVYEWDVKNPGSISSLKVTGSVSANGTARVYIENEGERKLLFDSTKQLFDVSIHVLPEYKKVMQGDKILIENRVFNLRGFGAGNVNVRYAIKDSNGNIIAAQEEVVYIETQAKFIRELVIPAEIEAGTYTAFVEVYTNETIVGTGSDAFEIMAKLEVPYYQQLKPYIIVLAAAIAFVIVLVLGIHGANVLKKKKEIEELKKKEPLERIEKLGKELKALEEAHKSGFISKESYEKEKKRIEEKLGVSRK